MTIKSTAEYLNVSPWAVRDMIADGRLHAYRLGKRVIRLRQSDIDAAMERIGGDAP
jgi:excisionase family DNA binding protein